MADQSRRQRLANEAQRLANTATRDQPKDIMGKIIQQVHTEIGAKIVAMIEAGWQIRIVPGEGYTLTCINESRRIDVTEDSLMEAIWTTERLMQNGTG